MVRFTVQFKSISDVKEFVQTVNSYSYDVDLSSGRYVVDAKSIMGIFSLDLSKPIKVEIQANDCGKFCEEIKRFTV